MIRIYTDPLWFALAVLRIAAMLRWHPHAPDMVIGALALCSLIRAWRVARVSRGTVVYDPALATQNTSCTQAHKRNTIVFSKSR